MKNFKKLSNLWWAFYLLGLGAFFELSNAVTANAAAAGDAFSPAFREFEISRIKNAYFQKSTEIEIMESDLNKIVFPAELIPNEKILLSNERLISGIKDCKVRLLPLSSPIRRQEIAVGNDIDVGFTSILSVRQVMNRYTIVKFHFEEFSFVMVIMPIDTDYFLNLRDQLVEACIEKNRLLMELTTRVADIDRPSSHPEYEETVADLSPMVAAEEAKKRSEHDRFMGLLSDYETHFNVYKRRQYQLADFYLWAKNFFQNIDEQMVSKMDLAELVEILKNIQFTFAGESNQEDQEIMQLWRKFFSTKKNAIIESIKNYSIGQNRLLAKYGHHLVENDDIPALRWEHLVSFLQTENDIELLSIICANMIEEEYAPLSLLLEERKRIKRENESLKSELAPTTELLKRSNFRAILAVEVFSPNIPDVRKRLLSIIDNPDARSSAIGNGSKIDTNTDFEHYGRYGTVGDFLKEALSKMIKVEKAKLAIGNAASPSATHSTPGSASVSRSMPRSIPRSVPRSVPRLSKKDKQFKKAMRFIQEQRDAAIELTGCSFVSRILQQAQTTRLPSSYTPSPHHFSPAVAIPPRSVRINCPTILDALFPGEDNVEDTIQ
ncbi:MAG: hypothetical protein HQK53_12125 [Oligoflexia bacterium]|nr:hypothetical protein [Oligoflexia bacterium]